MARAKFNGVPFHAVEKIKKKRCLVCNSSCTPKSGVNKFCSEQCKGRWKYITGQVSTDSQYKEISGNWKRYLSRLMYHGGRRRDKLNVDILLSTLKRQDYKCALSGVPLTCILSKGRKHPTNVSIDRIIPGGPYTENNIQLVCRALNSWRADLSVDEFTDWCKKVVNHQTERRQVQDGQA